MQEKGYYGAVVAAPVFKEIAQKIYTTTPIQNQSVSDTVKIKSVEKEYDSYYAKLRKKTKKVPNVKGMSGMDAVSLLENLGLKVKFTGTGKVREQSLEKGQEFKKGNTITLKLS